MYTSIKRTLNLKEVLMYELSTIPPALFDENGDMRSQGKASLKNKLQVGESIRYTNNPDAIVIDGSAMLWSVHWPASGTVEEYIKNFMGSLQFYLRKSCVYLIFDRYYPTSTKGCTRSNRAGKNASRKHVLTLYTPLPAQKVVLNVTQNKSQLIKLIHQYLVEHLTDNNNKLVITSEHPVPVAIKNGQITLMNCLHNTHEEADVIIVNQLVYLAGIGASHISVICDDTDVFVLLIHFYCKQRLNCRVTMESPIVGRSVIDITATAHKHKDIANFLPAAHALSGCDTTSYLYGIGKATALKVLSSGQPLGLLGQESANMDDVVSEATSFISKCYGSICVGDMSDMRYAVWLSKMARPKISSAPSLKSLPPTSDAFDLHVRRAHHQTIIWNSSLSSAPPASADPVQFGWAIQEGNLFPVMLPADVSPVPVEVLQMIKCGCSSTRPCATSRCSCFIAQMSCSMFCSCHAGAECNNIHTRNISSQDDDATDDEHF